MEWDDCNKSLEKDKNDSTNDRQISPLGQMAEERSAPLGSGSGSAMVFLIFPFLGVRVRV